MKLYAFFLLDCTVGKICVDCLQIPVNTAHRTCESLTKPVVSIFQNFDIMTSYPMQVLKCSFSARVGVKLMLYIYRLMITSVSVAVIVLGDFLKIITVVV